jgi:IS30 family transposase
MSTTYSHLIIQERITIQTMLDQNKSISQIAKQLGRNKSTISREIRKNKVKYEIKTSLYDVNSHYAEGRLMTYTSYEAQTKANLVSKYI